MNGKSAAGIRAIGLILICLCLGIAPAVASGPERPAEVSDFVLDDLDGNPVRLSDFRGRAVLINFWATWCGPCVEELPTLEGLRRHFQDRPFSVIAINLGEDAQTVRDFLDTNALKLNMILLIDEGGTVAETYCVRGLPATLLIDRDGRVVFGGVGQRDWNSPEVHAEILPVLE
ncbi:MAG: TlpA family protein disulfide reductase [Gammaproteobacteria bacterium]|nr:TlpA family protein disulfide reductase [Gammaproteobacteria bacterium]MYD75546.1 TlpA family protein disulfide reductase [Gammaproteobacteria bacterium]MYJ53201.1 TlpA family protein disulfide reductase [Gammaproteobacteria bacterium]